MSPTPDPATLAEALPGRWVVRATNFPMWLKGDRLDPVFEYGLIKASPLVLSDRVEYQHEKGETRTVLGTDRQRGDGFVWRGRGVLGLLRSRWHVTGLDGDVLAIRFQRSAVTPAGVDVLVREGVEIDELRSWVAADLERLGISVAEFAGLSWLDHTPR